MVIAWMGALDLLGFESFVLPKLNPLVQLILKYVHIVLSNFLSGE